ncbi:zinc-binding protein A33-like [Clarias magur]|uniref:Zinc-binding protein A33-like n=1 Tax=Clarias magur TaxID=1594786 RepID=A0A8J4TXT9_CLAMG|nr:zinc-binding protein A33-like [Clarias magur]
MKSQSQDTPLNQQEHLKKQRNILAYQIKKLSAKQKQYTKETAQLKEKIKKKYDEMKRVLDEDLRITMCQLDMEQEAIKRSTEENIERIMEALKMIDPEHIQMDEFKNKQLLSLTLNLLLFIRSQVPVTKKLFQSYAQEVILNPESAHPKLIISPAGDSVTYTDSWQDVPENLSRFDTTLNVISLEGFKEGRSYWEVQVSGKTYWELGLTYPSIPRKGHEEQCWLGRGPESW